MNILFTVCCRAGSKGLKNKNLRLFSGTPLVNYTLAAIRLFRQKYGASDMIHICLNTDSEELITQVLDYKPEVFIIRRDEFLVGDTVPKMAVVKDCLRRSESDTGVLYDIVVDLDVTSPLRRVRDIHAAVSLKQEKQDVDVVFSVTSARRNPYFNMVKRNSDGTVDKVLLSDFTARQQAPELFDMNASIYAYDAEFLRSNKSDLLFDGRCDSIKMLDTAVLDIDSEEDFVLMEVVAEHFYKTDAEFGEIAEAARG